jgi:type III effector protein PopP2
MRVDYAHGSNSTPPPIEVYHPHPDVDMSGLQSPGTRTTHEMYWQSAAESGFAPPLDSIGGEHSSFPYRAEAGNMYMPHLPPLSPSPWEEWIRQDDLALQEAAAACGATNIASTSYGYNVDSAQAQQARSDLMSTLNSALSDLEGLVNNNTDPELAGYPIKQLDRQIMPLLIAAENWRRPNLNLIALHTSEAACVDSDDEDMDEQAPMAGSQEIDDFVKYHPNGRYRALIDNGQHTRVADIHKSESGVSVILLDSLRVEKDEKEYDDYAVYFKQEFGTHAAARCAFIPVDLQKSAFGCRIFSMSLALKMQAREGDFTNMHSALYSGDLSPVVPGSMQTEDDEDAHVVLDAGPLIDASMLKHNQSRSSIKKYLQSNPDQDNVIVNKHGETLRTRANRHTVERKVLAQNESGRKTITFNNSIELKRIALVRRALHFVSVAPPEDVIQLSALIN